LFRRLNCIMIGRVGTILASFLFFPLEVPHQADLI